MARFRPFNATPATDRNLLTIPSERRPNRTRMKTRYVDSFEKRRSFAFLTRRFGVRIYAQGVRLAVVARNVFTPRRALRSNAPTAFAVTIVGAGLALVLAAPTQQRVRR